MAKSRAGLMDHIVANFNTDTHSSRPSSLGWLLDFHQRYFELHLFPTHIGYSTVISFSKSSVRIPSSQMGDFAVDFSTILSLGECFKRLPRMLPPLSM